MIMNIKIGITHGVPITKQTYCSLAYIHKDKHVHYITTQLHCDEVFKFLPFSVVIDTRNT
jgi:hypothetical protein